MPQAPDHILIFAQAPAKPALGAPCNGCGVCCLLAPCPLGVVLSGHRHGQCQALRWDAYALRYRCGAITHPEEVLTQRLPGRLRWAGTVLGRALPGLATRWVAAGRGCDCDAEMEPCSGPAAWPAVAEGERYGCRSELAIDSAVADPKSMPTGCMDPGSRR